MRLISFFLAAGSLSAQALAPPLAGTLVDSHGRILSLHGVMGNLLPPEYSPSPSELEGEPILSAAFPANGAVLKTSAHLAFLDSQGNVISMQSAPAGPALFSPSGYTGWVLYSATGELVNVTTGTSLNASTFGDAVLALGPAAGSTLPLLVSRGSQIWSGSVSLSTGAFNTEHPVSGSAPCVFFQGGWLTTANASLVWTPLGNGAAAAVPLPEAARTLQIAGEASIAVNAHWLLNAKFQVLEIPAAARVAPGVLRGNPPMESLR